MTARLMAQSLIDAGENLVILTPVWPNIAAVVTMRTLLIAQPTDPERLFVKSRDLGLGAASTPPLRLC